MFGYVNILKDELKIKDYNIYRAYYCGLCKALGKNSQAVRLGLSYDMTFLAVLLSAVCDDEVKTVPGSCVLHPFKKRSFVNNPSLDYCAHMSIILTYLKLYDDWIDDKSLKALFAMFFYYFPLRKLRKKYSKSYNLMKDKLNELAQLERENCSDIDNVADCFAQIMKELFSPNFVDENNRRILGWVGYNIGRWIYILDAFDDLEKDRKKGNYNPLLLSANDHLEESLTFTLENAASSFELLDIKINSEILKNIIYDGLKFKQDVILNRVSHNERNGNNNEPL